MSSYNIQDVIRFADGDMMPEEKRDFERALEGDERLKEELSLYQDVRKDVELNLKPDANREALKMKLEALNKQYFKRPERKTIRIQPYWYAAAALLIALLIWAPWNKNLFETYSATTMVSFAERGDDTDLRLQNATDAFNAEKFEEAGDLLAQLIQEHEDDDLFKYYYYGISLLHTDEILAARDQLQKVYQGESLLRFDAAYFIALSYLKEDNEEMCKVWLGKIPENTEVSLKSQALLKELE